MVSYGTHGKEIKISCPCVGGPFIYNSSTSYNFRVSACAVATGFQSSKKNLETPIHVKIKTVLLACTKDDNEINHLELELARERGGLRSVSLHQLEHHVGVPGVATLELLQSHTALNFVQVDVCLFNHLHGHRTQHLVFCTKKGQKKGWVKYKYTTKMVTARSIWYLVRKNIKGVKKKKQGKKDSQGGRCGGDDGRAAPNISREKGGQDKTRENGVLSLPHVWGGGRGVVVDTGFKYVNIRTSGKICVLHK